MQITVAEHQGARTRWRVLMAWECAQRQAVTLHSSHSTPDKAEAAAVALREKLEKRRP